MKRVAVVLSLCTSLIAILLTVLSSAGIQATETAEAASAARAPLPIPVGPVANIPSEDLNYEETDTIADPARDAPQRPVLLASGNEAAVDVQALPNQSGASLAWVGLEIDWIFDEEAYTWEMINDAEIEVMVDFSYQLMANLAVDGSASAGIRVEPAHNELPNGFYKFLDSTGMIEGQEMITFTTTLEELLGNPPPLTFHAFAQADTGNDIPPFRDINAANARIVANGIRITFPPDLAITDLEVTQAIQNLDHDVRLVKDKRTFVRMHVMSNRPDDPQKTTAQLRVTAGGNEVVIKPIGDPILTVKPDPKRGILQEAFLFELPRGYREGTVTIKGELNHADGRARDPEELTYDNNELERTVSFESVPALNVVLYSVGYKTGSTTHFPSLTDRNNFKSWLERAFPVHDVNLSLRFYTRSGGLPTCDQINNEMASKRRWDRLGGWLSSRTPYATRYIGMVSDKGGFMRGCVDEIPSFTAATPTGAPTGGWSWDKDGSYGDWYGAHELAHAYGRLHVFCSGREGGVDSGYPHPRGRISTARSGDEEFMGFDSNNQGKFKLYNYEWRDVMTYCPKQWISEYTYEGLMTKFQNLETDPGTGGTRLDRLLIIGSITTPTLSVSLEPIYLVPDAPDIEPRTPGDFTIVLYDDALELARYPFTPESAEREDAPFAVEDEDILLIRELVPAITGTNRVDIEGPTGVLTTVTAGKTPPSIALTTLRHVAAADQLDLTWSAADPDGDDVYVHVQYSPDGGTTWELIAQNVTGGSISIDTNNLVASNDARVRLWVTDGINTGSTTSDPFVVENHIPTVEIVTPAEDVTVAISQTLTLEADAYDADTGTMDDAMVSWSSDLDGVLGTGRELTLLSLSVGTHEIAVTADDGAGGVVSDTVNVTMVADVTDLPEPDDTLLLSDDVVLVVRDSDELTATIDIVSLSGQPLAVSAISTDFWLDASLDQAQTPAVMQVTVDPDLLPAEAVSDTVTVSSADLPGESYEVIVVVDAAPLEVPMYVYLLPFINR